MSTCHKHFIKFNLVISMDETRCQRVLASQRLVVKVLGTFVNKELGLGKPKFMAQGSYRFGTVVKEDFPDFDLDLGMYFKTKPRFSPRVLKAKINEEAYDITSYGSEDRIKCIQIYFRDEYSIDIPIYYFDKQTKKTYLATKNGWVSSDAIGFEKWVRSRLKGNKQAVRIIKYLKKWTNSLPFKTPSGVALTVLVLKHHKLDIRDDISFIKTVKSVFRSLKKKRSCVMAVEPYDDLLRKLSWKQLSNYLKGLEGLIRFGEIILKCHTVKDAVSSWRKVLGKSFPIRL